MTDTILTEPIIPDFGDAKAKAKPAASPADPASAAGAPATTPAAAPAPRAEASEPAPRKFVVICSKGNLDMAYPGLVLANAALGEGIETHIFFTFWGFDMITERYMDDLQHTMVGNTAMHLPQAPGLRLPAVMGVLPGMNRLATSMMKKSLDELEIPSVREMLDIIVAAGGHLWGCRMSFDMNKLDENDLYEGVEGIISATDFIELSEGGQIVFI